MQNKEKKIVLQKKNGNTFYFPNSITKKGTHCTKRQ